MTVGSLFAGIGGFDLGFERAGFEIKWQVEIDPFCRQVLAKHWPTVKRYEDVRHCGSREWADGWMQALDDGGCADGPSPPTSYYGLEPVDVICGGFPCQDISFAGPGGGLAGDRSGLWSECARIIGSLRPRYAVMENVAALLVRGMDTVVGDLARIGYDARWTVVSACAFGAPHVRRRVFIVAYPNSEHGCSWVRGSTAPAFRPLQDLDGFESARAGYRERLADPSALYRGADGVPDRVERNRAIGNSVHPEAAQWIAEQIMRAEQLPTRIQVGVPLTGIDG